jgi:hypothetical protein
MRPRSLACWALSAALLLAPAAARADIASPDMRIVPTEAVLTGLHDFPAYRFVIAVANPESVKDMNPPPPVSVKEGENVPTSTIFFQRVRAIPASTPEPVTDAWLASSQAPGSGLVTRHPLRVHTASTERVARLHFQVRQIQAGFVSLELLSAVVVMPDGSERAYLEPIPRSIEVGSLAAPPGFRLFLMPDPARPRAEPPLPAVPCTVGEVLPSSPGAWALMRRRRGRRRGRGSAPSRGSA